MGQVGVGDLGDGTQRHLRMTQRVYWSWYKIDVEGVALDPRVGATAIPLKNGLGSLPALARPRVLCW